jgi:hypothetical protein
VGADRCPGALDDRPGRHAVDQPLRQGGRGGNFKGGYGFHPKLAYGDQTGAALGGELRPSNAGANTATDQIQVAEHALEQIPAEHIQGIELLLRVDSAGASHELLDWCREGLIHFSVGYDLTEQVRDAILQIRDDAWVCALDQDGSKRPNGQVAEITEALDLTGWPERSRVIIRRERAHPGAQLSFSDHDGHRFQAILTDQPGEIAAIERDHRGRARVEDHIRNDKDTGLRNMPFRDFEHNRVWLQLVLIAHDLIRWTQRLLLCGELARAEPKRLRYRLLHVAARLAFHARTATLHLQANWPWATDLAAAFARLSAGRAVEELDHAAAVQVGDDGRQLVTAAVMGLIERQSARRAVDAGRLAMAGAVGEGARDLVAGGALLARDLGVRGAIRHTFGEPRAEAPRDPLARRQLLVGLGEVRARSLQR